MKNDIMNSCISVPIPTELYVRMLDFQSKSNRECGPASMVTSILQKYLDEAGANLPSSNAKLAALNWSNDWMMFGAPPAVAEVKAPGSGKNPGKQSKDWCIGCACPAEALLS